MQYRLTPHSCATVYNDTYEACWKSPAQLPTSLSAAAPNWAEALQDDMEITARPKNSIIRLWTHFGDEYVQGVRRTMSTPGEEAPEWELREY